MAVFRLEDLQVEGLLEQAAHLADARECALQRRCGAWFNRDDKGQIASLKAGLLKDGVDVDFLLSQGQGYLVDDARLIAYEDSYKVPQQKRPADRCLSARQLHCARAVRDADDVGYNCHSGRMAAGT